MTKAQKKMKYLGIAYFIFALIKVVVGGLIIWTYAHNFSFRGDENVGTAILSLSFHIIIDVLSWSFCMRASKDSSQATPALALALFCLLGNVCYSINNLVLNGAAGGLAGVPWISLTMYVLTALTALKIRQESTLSKTENVSQTTH